VGKESQSRLHCLLYESINHSDTQETQTGIDHVGIGGHVVTRVRDALLTRTGHLRRPYSAVSH
jgi:hypothetical protein